MPKAMGNWKKVFCNNSQPLVSQYIRAMPHLAALINWHLAIQPLPQPLATKQQYIMKKYINYIVFLISVTACKAQTPVYDISEPTKGKPQGAYYKDINGVLDGYDGTYLYTNGNTSLKFILKKKVKSLGYSYKDLVVGEFQFIKDGVERGNTLANMTVNYTNEWVNHIIKGNRIITGTELGCPDCSPTEKRLRLSFVDNKSPNIAGIDIRKTTVNGMAAIKVKIWWDGFITRKEGDPAPTPASINTGEYLMIKQ